MDMVISLFPLIIAAVSELPSQRSSSSSYGYDALHYTRKTSFGEREKRSGRREFWKILYVLLNELGSRLSHEMNQQFDDADNYYQGGEGNGVKLVSLKLNFRIALIKHFYDGDKGEDDMENGLDEITRHYDIGSGPRSINPVERNSKASPPDQEKKQKNNARNYTHNRKIVIR
jgi:hypothetical protein